MLASPINAATNQTGASIFSEKELTLDDYSGLFITPRIEAENFRHRFSRSDYKSDWHMAGDPTLIIIRSGTLRVGLRSGEQRDFSAGDMFVAQDYLQPEEDFDDQVHGHNAQVAGNEPIEALHIKLSARYDID
ncbi:MAG: hypothetical protein GY843_00480 [Neptuniibacter sp.]|nr:hypothetical protein [Neptuniibacter sp.]